MSYLSALRKNNDVVVWERTPSGREMKVFPAPFYFYVKDDEGDYKTMYGEKVSRVDFNTSKEFNMARANCESDGIKMFESDIPPELKLLSASYYNVPAPKPNVTFLDIEVDYNEQIGFSSIDNPYAPINSVAYYHDWSKRMVVHAIVPDKYEGDPSDLIEEGFIDKLNAITPLPDDVQIDFKFCRTEKELLTLMLFELQESDIISGWNSDFFDVPYIGKRVELALGKKGFNMLSFDGANPPRWRTVEVMCREMETLDLSGRSSLDYMVLFKKYEMDERPSYKLESIANEMLTDLPKLEYEGSLAGLYRKDFPYFVRYNLRDTEILKGLEDRLGYVETANQMCHMSTGLFDHVAGTLKLAELATINYCHHDLGGLIVPDNHVPEENAQIQGALVLKPQVGMHDQIGSVDINSLYPSAIRSINISPETIIGQFFETGQQIDYSNPECMVPPHTVLSANLEIAKRSDVELHFTVDANGQEIVAPAHVWADKLREGKLAISGYGTVFDQNQEGIIPSILATWYAKRQEYQRLKGEAKREADELLQKYNKKNEIVIITQKTAAGEGGFDCAGVAEEDPQPEQQKLKGRIPKYIMEKVDELKITATYYDKLQYVYKIKLNSFYGALTNKYFRFFDLRMGESTTSTGRLILTHQCATVCKILDGEYLFHPDVLTTEIKAVKGEKKKRWNYGYSDKWSVVYGDTDSTYFITHGENNAEGIAIANRVGELCNDSFPEFMSNQFLCNPGYNTIIKTGREIVADRGIFVDKKRYILHIIDDEGDAVDKIKVMGLDTKKTTMPKFISDKLNAFVGRLLKGEDWSTIAVDVVALKTEIEEGEDFVIYGLPKGIQGIEDYTKRYAQDATIRIPGHVAAAIVYNMCLDEYGDKESMRIYSGMKLKVFYLNKPIGRFKSIALPVDIEQLPVWFTRDFVPLIHRQAHILRLVDKPLGNIIKAVGLDVPSKQTLLLDDLFEW